ncbi:protein FMC1 homolog [Micropterus salmoides]|uniref:protein FMC1 homolog n=1 Tax=Micropterus salmoides TaxID=27706 RepID=UPI0018EAC6AB|nr:protein FMC1 homolog [Micropterus salmoides]XP_045892598.1 protein FMC1 homolog [Micropterus dolomieu]
MAALTPPLRACRGILKELRALQGPRYRQSLAYNYVMDQFRKNKVTGERYCRAQQEAHHASDTYLCLLASTRNHLVLHNLYHGKGELNQEEAAGLVGLRLPTQPGGKGWEK